MKKSHIILIILEILLIITIVGHNVFNIGAPKNIENIIQKELKGDEVASLNHLLKYKMPKGYQDSLNLYGEIAIENPETSTNFTMDIIDKDLATSEKFFETQEEIFSQSANFSVVSENTSELSDRTITKKVYKVTNDFLELYSLIATMEVKNRPDDFIGIIGTSSSPDNEKDLDSLLNSINYTNQTLNKEKLFSSDLENIKLTIPPNWKRFERIIPYSFYKQDKENISYIIASSANKNEQDPKENYEFTKENLSADEAAHIVEDSKVETNGNKTITTTTINYDGSHITTILTLIEFKNSDIFSLVRADIISENDTDSIKSEVNSIINSINLK